MWPLTGLAKRSAEFEALTTDPCDPALDGFAQLRDLPLSDGLHLRGVSAEVSRDRNRHCLLVQRLVERIPLLHAGTPPSRLDRHTSEESF